MLWATIRRSQRNDHVPDRRHADREVRGGKHDRGSHRQYEDKDNKGLFGLERQERADTVLIPGLKVDIDGTPDGQGRVIATTITVDGDDLETSEMIEAGLNPTKVRHSH